MWLILFFWKLVRSLSHTLLKFSMLCLNMNFFHTCAGTSVGSLSPETYVLQFWNVFSNFIWFLPFDCFHSFWNSVIQHLGLGLLNWSSNFPLFILLFPCLCLFALFFEIFPQFYFQLFMGFFILSLIFLTSKSSFVVISRKIINDSFSEVFSCFFQKCLVFCSLLRLFKEWDTKSLVGSVELLGGIYYRVTWLGHILWSILNIYSDFWYQLPGVRPNFTG